MSASKASHVVFLALILAACSGDNGTSADPDLRAVCVDANQFQRDATALEDAIRPATDDEVSTLNDQAEALSVEISAEISSGNAAGTTINDDLTGALNAVGRIITDLSTPNLEQAKTDVEVLRNAMVQLGQDCSQYLT